MGTIQKQKGFGAVEALLILVIIGMLGFTGWYVWHAKQTADKTLSADNSSTPTFKKNSTDKNPDGSTGVLISSSTVNGVFKIPQLGIKLVNVPSDIQDLTGYQNASQLNVDPNNKVKTPVKFVGVQFSTNSLTK